MVFGKIWRQALALVITGTALFWVDRRIGGIDQGGPYREALREPLRRAERAREAEHVVLGCSTVSWLPRAIAGQRKLPNGKVLDAHISDCHQSCSMAEAVKLARMGRHYQSATFGVNMFEYCQSYRARRSMQEVELLPFDESLRLLPVYLQSDDPLRLTGGWLLNQVSQVYGNTMWLQRHVRKDWFGKESLAASWYRKSEPEQKTKTKTKTKRRQAFRCDYLEADRRYGTAATRAALEAALELADQVYLVLLPDKVYSDPSETSARANETFLTEHAALVSDLERVQMIELVDPRVIQPRHFRDNAHLNRQGISAASKLFRRKLSQAALGSLER